MGSRLVDQLGAHSVAGASAAELAERIRALILDGRLTVGERLPSERALALELRRSRSTTTRTYDTLASLGYVDRVHGGGTRVALPHASSIISSEDAGEIDLSQASMGSTPGLYDATVRALPRLAALRGSSGYVLPGLPDLRDRIAERFTERGVPTSPEQVLITAGAIHALNLVLTAFGRRGGTALVEQPSFPQAIDALRRHGHRLIPSPVTPDGWDVPHVTDSILRHRPDIAYLIPDFQNPTGATLSDADRARIAATASNVHTRIIVDETTTELDIDRTWTPTPMGAHRDVITIGSMSKLAWGGLRLGWIRSDTETIERLVRLRASYDLGTALLEQCIAIELLEDLPALTRHVRARLTTGRSLVLSAVAEMNGVTAPSPHGGLSAWIDLGSPSSTALSLAARERGLILPPGPRFATSPVLERHIRIPITLEPDVAADALQRLGDAWDAVSLGNHPLRGSALLSAIV